MEKISYGGWPDCIRMTNGLIEIVATTDVGPRIIRFGFVGEENEFFEDETQIGRVGAGEWLLFGGHRLWIAPEAKPRSYFPDSRPVEANFREKTLSLTAPIEPTTGIRKEISVTLNSAQAQVKVLHRLTNCSLCPVTLAPWALSVMRKGGTAFFPQEEYAPHPDAPGASYLPVRSMALWSYTDLADSRWRFTKKYILFRQDPAALRALKFGISNRPGWAAYLREGKLFVKKSMYIEGAVYPDCGSSFESFTNSDMLELETLGPLVTLEPEESVTHIEEWFIFKGVSAEETDESIDANILSKIERE